MQLTLYQFFYLYRSQIKFDINLARSNTAFWYVGSVHNLKNCSEILILVFDYYYSINVRTLLKKKIQIFMVELTTFYTISVST